MARIDPTETNLGSGAVSINSIDANSSNDGVIQIEYSDFLFTADFSRDGTDLTIAGQDGRDLVIEDYFLSENPADLKSPEGAVLRGDVVAKIAGPANPGAYAQQGQIDGSEAIGQVETLEGSATVQRADGTNEPLQVGTKIFQNDVVQTGEGSSLSLTFVDGTIFTLSAASRMVLDELIYDPGSNSNSAVFNLVEGTFVFIAGQVAKTGGMEVNTPVATMGIRGTTVKVDIETINGVSTVEISLNRDPDGGIGNFTITDLSGEVIATVIGTESKWIVSPVDGETREITRTAVDLADDQAALNLAVTAHQNANQRVQDGGDFVEGDGGNQQENQENQQDDNPETPGDQTNLGSGLDSNPIKDSQLPDSGIGTDGVKLTGLGDQGEKGPPPPPPQPPAGGPNDDAPNSDGPPPKDSSNTPEDGDPVTQTSGETTTETKTKTETETETKTETETEDETEDETVDIASALSLPDFNINVPEDGAIVLSGFNIAGTGDTILTVYLIAASTITIPPGSGVTFATGFNGNDEHNTQFSGTASQINAALNGLTYKPTPDDDDGGSLTIILSNGVDAVTKTLNIGITPVQDAPVAVDDVRTVLESAGITTGNLITDGTTGDSDADGDSLTIISAVDSTGAPITIGTPFFFGPGDDASIILLANGSYTINLGGAFDALNDGQTSTFALNYTISDGHGNTDTATATLNVQGVSPRIVATVGSDVAAGNDVLATSATSEFLVNTETGGHQFWPAVATLNDGNFVVTWHSNDAQDDLSDYGVKVQIYDASGTAVGGEFLVNTATSGEQSKPVIVALSNGGFLIVWQSLEVADPNGYDVFGQIFDAVGNKVGGEFSVNSLTDANQFEPAVASLAGGGFVISWTSHAAPEALGGARAQIYDDYGNPVGGEIEVNTGQTGFQGDPEVIGLSNGGFVVVWQSDDVAGDASGSAISAQIFDATGNPVDDEFLINTQTNSNQTLPTVTAISTGGFVVVWTSNDGVDDTNGEGIKAQIFDSSGDPIGSEFLVNTQENNDQKWHSVVTLADGRILVAWTSYDGVEDTSVNGIKAQIYEFDGKAVGGEFLVNSEKNLNQEVPSIAALSNGGFVVSWHSFDGVNDVNGYGIKAQIFDADGNNVGNGFSENIVATFGTSEFLANDIDNSGGTLEITAVNGTSTNGAAITLNADKTISYDPTNAAAIQALAAGETLVDTFTYTVTSSNGDTDTATVTLTVIGQNDAPTVNGVPIGDVQTPTGVALAGVSLPSGAFLEVDTGDTLTLEAFIKNGANEDALSTVGLSFDGVNFTGTTPGAGVIKVTVRATDSQGGTTEFDFEIFTGVTVTGTSSADTHDADAGGSDNFVLALEGDDTIFDKNGDDIFHGGDGSDTVDYSGATSAVTVDLAAGTATGGAGNDTLISIENVTGTAYNDTITGDDGDNFLKGGEGNDNIVGGAGFDDINGGDDDDTINPGSNNNTNDQLRASEGNDTYDLADVDANSWVSFIYGDGENLIDPITFNIDTTSTTATVSKGDSGDDTIINFQNLTFGSWWSGGELNDTFNATSDGEVLVVLNGGEGVDTFNIDTSAGGQVRLSYKLFDNPTSMGINADLSNLDTGFDAAITDLDGNDDIISAGSTGFEIQASHNSDTILGSNNDESFIGRASNGGVGFDDIDGGGGTDTIRYDRSGVDSLSVDMTGTNSGGFGTATGNWDGNAFTHHLKNIEIVKGSSNDDTIIGNDAGMTLDGREGDDTILGGSGADTVTGGSGDDTISGKGGLDTLNGGSGDDNIAIGSASFARVDGDGGQDTLQLLGGGLTINLTNVTAGGLELAGIETIDLATDTAADTITLNSQIVQDASTEANDVMAANGFISANSLLIEGDSNDVVNLNNTGGDNWTLVSSFTDAGETYDVYNFTDGVSIFSTVAVDDDVAVVVA